jgi:predicted nuclease with TOPRIM domain
VRVATTGSCGHLNLDQDFVRQLWGSEFEVFKCRTVPIPAGHDIEDLTFAVTDQEAKAALQIAGLFSLTWWAPVPRYLTATNGRFPVVQFNDFR